MKLENIGFYTMSDERCKNASASSPIWRAEILLTDRCNFKCPYCRGIKSEIQNDLPLKEVIEILTYLFQENVENIRFSGGEPTLYESLHDLVALCKWNNVNRIAISTNGSAPLHYYKELINQGVNDFSISLDACCTSTANIMTGKQGYYNTIIDNIRELSKLTYVTVGIVFDEKNISQLNGVVQLANDLEVSDIRIIPSAQYNQEAILTRLQFDFIDKYPILKYRLNNHNSGINIRGLSKSDNKHCPLVLDDIAIAGNYHYPCIIYLREQGDPIGNLSHLSEVREQRQWWYFTHNCYEDKICKKQCLDVCRAYNNKYEELRKDNNNS